MKSPPHGSRHRLLGIVLLCACATQQHRTTQTRNTAPAAAPAASDASPDCGPSVRGADEIVSAGSVTLFGEIHGTDAAPALFGRIACHAATRPDAKGVLVGLEIPRGDQGAIDAALVSSSASAARQELVAGNHFQDEWQDGRDTDATVALVERVRMLRNAGLAVDIVAFDVDPDMAAPADRDAKMAEHLAEAIASHSGATVLVLSGNLHSRTTRGVPWDPSYVPMGAHLVERFPTLRALDLATAGGTSWMCVVPSPPPRFGILMKPLPDELARRVGKAGVLVHDVAANSPAARAGLQKGDVVVSRDGKPVDDIEPLRKAIAEAPAGATIELAIWRDGATQKLKCDLGDPPSEPPKATCGEHPMQGEDLGPEPFIELHEDPDANGHHGRWYVGRVRASPPAARSD